MAAIPRPAAAAEPLSVDPRVDPRWLALAGAEDGSVFTSPPWIGAVYDSYGFTPEARIAVDPHGAPVAGFAWMRVTDLRGDRLISLPFSDRAEPLGNASAWESLACEAITSGLPLTVRGLEGWPSEGDPRWAQTGAAVWHSASLQGTLEEVFGRLHPSTRRNIRAADRNGLKIVQSTDLEAVRLFHRLHVRLRKGKYRLLAPPLDFFERIWSAFAPTGVLTVLAYADDAPVAGAMYLVWNDVLYYKFSASLVEQLSRRPNEVIQWAAIRWAKERGLALLDLGLSDLDQPGLVHYKRKWAADERRVLTVRANAAPAGARAGETDAVLRHLTRLFTDERVSDDVSAEAGALLYRYFC